MHDDLNSPVFDEVISMEIDLPGLSEPMDLVTHRDPDGKLFAWHSPLAHGTIKCSICEGGARVYMRTEAP